MNRSKPNNQLSFAGLGLAVFLVSSQLQAQEASAECRGVAAGVVAAMRSTGELSTQAETEVAVVAARRGCMAASENLGAAPSSTEVVSEKTEEKEKIKMWDLLSSDQESKPGSKRLKRLRQQ